MEGDIVVEGFDVVDDDNGDIDVDWDNVVDSVFDVVKVVERVVEVEVVTVVVVVVVPHGSFSEDVRAFNSSIAVCIILCFFI